MSDPYASEEESNAVITPDTRTPYQKMLDQMLDIHGANEQGAEPYPILYKIATNLLVALYRNTTENDE
jgi:hypothetical protein